MSGGSQFGQQQAFEEWSRRIHDMMDQMLRRHFVDFRSPDSWAPHANLYESEKAFHICVELASVEKRDIQIECSDPRRVVISGCREKPLPGPEVQPLAYHLMEIHEGPFRREIQLPSPVAVDQVEARYSKGYLWIRLPKSNPSK